MRGAFASVLIGLAFLASGARAAVVEQFQAADWSGIAFADDQTGKLSSCSVFAEYRHGVTLYFFKVPDAGWILGFDKQDWALNPGDQHRISYQVDRRPVANAEAAVINPTLLGVFLSEDDPLIGEIRRGNWLAAELLGMQYPFDLSNSNRALNAAEDCVARHLAAGPARQPAGEAEVPPHGPENPAPGSEAEVAREDSPSGEPGPPAAAEDNAAAGGFTTADWAAFDAWIVLAVADGAGNFANCAAVGVYGSDQLIVSHYPGERWEIGIHRGAWALDPNQTYFLWYNIDAPADAPGVIKRPVEANAPNRIFFDVSEMEDIIVRMEGGRVLNVQLRGFSMEPDSSSYPLDRAAEALASVRECTRHHTEPAAAEVGPPAQEPPESGAGEEDATARALPALGEELIEEFQVPGWQAGAYADAGAFTHCAIRAQYDNGTALGVARTADGSLLLALDRSDWSLPAETLAAVVTIGGGLPAARSGEPLGTTMAVIDLRADAQMTSDLADAKVLVAEVGGRALDFDISDIGPGIAAIDACAERHAQTAAAESDAATAAKAETAAPSDDAAKAADAAALRTEAAGYTTALLIRSGYADHVMLSGDDVPQNMRDRHAAWQIGEVMGTSDVVSRSIEEVKAEVEQRDRAECAGTLTTGTKAEDQAGRAHFFSLCDTDTDVATHHVVVPRADGGSYVLTLMGLGDGAAAEAIAGKVFQAASAS